MVTAQRLRVFTHVFTGARGAHRQPGARRPRALHASFCTSSCKLALGIVGFLQRLRQQLRPSPQVRFALSRGVFASSHARRGIHMPAHAMGA